jgi:cytochrome P450
MRWDAAAQGFVRTPTQDVELHGRTIPEGSQVLLHIGSANRDEREFPAADKFDLSRHDTQHLGLGHSRHFCVGAPLARLVAKSVWDELLQVAHRWEPDFATARRVTTPNFRGFIHLEVSL